MSQATELVPVGFHGDVIEAAKTADGTVVVAMRRVCDNLGIKMPSQLRKLKAAPWATVINLITVAEDGKSREMACVDLKTLTMWLATIETGKIHAGIRPKIELYQCKAADVLADHFLGGRKKDAGMTPDALAVLEKVADAVSLLAERQDSLERHLDGRLSGLLRLSPPAELVTVADRLKYRWPNASHRVRDRVRDIAAALHVERTGERPGKLTGDLNGRMAFERQHLDLIDKAIDLVHEDESRQVVGPWLIRADD